MNAPGARTRDPRDFGRVAVLMGGDSAEREVSLASGGAVLEGLRASGVDAHPVDRDDAVIEVLRGGAYDRAFIALHGRGGEDGTLQGALEVAGIPYTGSGVAGCALAMDKRRVKLAWRGAGVATPGFRMLRGAADLEEAAAALGFPIAVKPVHEGSSVGISRAADPAGLREAWVAAREHDPQVIAEPWLPGPEYTVALLDAETLPAIRLEPAREFYDYEAKYTDGSGTRYHCPCGLSAGEEARLGRLALTAFEVAGGSGWGRVDAVCDRSGQPQVIDVNTAPGMTGHSLVPMAARAAGIGFEALVWRILETSL